MRAGQYATIVVLLVMAGFLALPGCRGQPSTPTAPLSFVAVKGDNPGETIVYVTNASQNTLPNCAMKYEGSEEFMAFAGEMKPNQVALSGLINLGSGTIVTYRCDGYSDVEYTIPAALEESADTSKFDWAESPELSF